MALNIEILERTFKMVAPRAEGFAADFYATLFADYPEAKPMFADTDMVTQQRKLITSLNYVVENLRYPEILGKSLKELGAKHVPHGAESNHYPAVGAALLKTLATYLGKDWTPEVEKAWKDAYGSITEVMLQGAKEYKHSRLQAASAAREYKLFRQKVSPNMSLFGQPMRGVTTPASIQATPTVLYAPPQGNPYSLGAFSLRTKLLIGLGIVAVILIGTWIVASQKPNSPQPAPSSLSIHKVLG